MDKNKYIAVANDIVEPIQTSAAILKKYENYTPETVEISSKETAILLHISPRTLEKWRPLRKNLSFIRTPGAVVYKLSDVLEFKNSLIVKAVPDEQFNWY